MKGSLQFVPEGWRVVPEEPTIEMQKATEWGDPVSWIYRDMIRKAPQLTTPPVLRWEGEKLMVGNHPIITTFCFSNKWYVQDILGIDGLGEFNTEQEARRAAEKALGIPFVVEEV